MIGASRATAALLAWVMLASPALAEPSEKDKQAAGELVKKAIARSQAGDHAAAIDLYLKAYTIVPNSILLSNIGTEFQASGKPAQALRYFCMYLDKDPSGTNAPYATMQARSLQIDLGNPDVDERDVCAPPRRPRRPPPPDGPPGTVPPAPQPSNSNTLMYVGLGTSLLGVGAAVVGAYAGIRAKAISDEISLHDRSKPWPTDIRELENRGQQYENIQIASLIAGGALIATGITLYVISRSSSETDKTAVRLAPTGNGVMVFGRF